MSKTTYTSTYQPSEAREIAQKLLLKFVRELAKADARRDRARAAGDWRRKPRKRVLTPRLRNS